MSNQSDRTHQWEYGLGAVLYDTRYEDGRGLCHVVGRYVNADNPYDREYKIADGTHTAYERLAPADVLDLFEPAGWQWPVGRKPTYWLTRICGVDDEMNLMTDGGRPSDRTDRVIDGQIHDGLKRYRLRERELSRGTVVDIKKQKRMHRFGSGYQDKGPALPLTHDLTEHDARAVRDLLDWWLDQLEDDNDE